MSQANQIFLSFVVLSFTAFIAVLGSVSIWSRDKPTGGKPR